MGVNPTLNSYSFYLWCSHINLEDSLVRENNLLNQFFVDSFLFHFDKYWLYSTPDYVADFFAMIAPVFGAAPHQSLTVKLRKKYFLKIDRAIPQSGKIM